MLNVLHIFFHYSETPTVLEGIGIIEKKSKNNIKWRQEVDTSRDSAAELAALRAEHEALAREEAQLDSQIATLQDRLRELASGEQCSAYAYVTHNDIKSIPELHGETLIAIKAPPGTELEVPDPDDGMPYGERRYEIFLKSSSGPIDCLLVSQGGDSARTENSVNEDTGGITGPSPSGLDSPLNVSISGASMEHSPSRIPLPIGASSCVATAVGGSLLQATPPRLPSANEPQSLQLHPQIGLTPSGNAALTPSGEHVSDGLDVHDVSDDVMGVLRLSPPPVEAEFYFGLGDRDEEPGITDLYDEMLVSDDANLASAAATSHFTALQEPGDTQEKTPLK